MIKNTDKDLCRAVIDALTPQTPAVRYRAAVAKFKRRTETRPMKRRPLDVKEMRQRGVTLYARTALGARGRINTEYVDGGGRLVELRRMPAFRARPYTRPEDRVVVERGALAIDSMRPHVETREAARTDEERSDMRDVFAVAIRAVDKRAARRIRMAAKRRRGWR